MVKLINYLIVRLTFLALLSNIKVHRFENLKGREFGECLVSNKSLEFNSVKMGVLHLYLLRN